MPFWLITTLSSVGGLVSSVWGMMTSLIKSGFNAAVQFHQEGIAFAREVGLNMKEAQAYTQVLTERTSELAIKYGVAADAIKEVQKNIVSATGKQYMLNNAEAERMVQINKLVGSSTSNIFTEQMMNHMGAQFGAVEGAISKAYATATKSGLVASKFSEKVARNLTIANKLSFRDGVNGIIRMTALSEKLGFNLQSIEGTARKFLELDEAIASSAHLQMLGGAAGAYGSNPLLMSYEANYDPEALTERMTNMLGGYAQFNRKTGLAEVNGMNRDFVKNIAEGIGISMDEAMSIAKKQAEVRYKEGAYQRELGNISRENRDAVLNKSYVDAITGHLMITDIRGNKHDITKNGLDEKIIEELTKFNDMDDRQLMESQATSLISINEQMKGIGASFAASLAQYLNEHIPGITTAIKNLAKEVKPIVNQIGKNLGEALKDIKSIINWLNKNILRVERVAKGVFGVMEFLTKHWYLLIGGAFLTPILNAILLGAVMRGIGGRTATGAKAAKAAKAPKAASATKGASGTGGKSFGTMIKNAGTSFMNSVKKAGTAIGNEFKKFRAWISKAGKGLWNTLKKAGNSLKNAITNGAKNAYNWFTKGKHANSARKAWGYAKSTFSNTGGATGRRLLHGARALWNNSRLVRGIGRGGGVLAVGVGAVEGGMSIHEYNKKKSQIEQDKLKSAQQKEQEIRDAAKVRNRGLGAALGGVGGGIAGGVLGSMASGALAAATTGALAGSVAPGVGTAIGGIVGAIAGLVIGGAGYYLGKKGGEALVDAAQGSVDHYSEGGIVGGNLYEGDKKLARVNSGEMILNKDQQRQLFDFIANTSNILKVNSSNGVSYYNAYNGSLSNLLSKVFNSNSNVVSNALDASNGLKTVPFGEDSFKKIPNLSDNTNSPNVSEVTIRDINLNVNGTIRLDGGSSSRNLDMNQLLSDSNFISSLKDLIKQSINNDINNGRFMNDMASMRGLPSQVTVWGK